VPIGQKRKPLGQILIEEGLLTEKELEEALAHQTTNGGALGRVLVDLGVATENDILLAIAKQAGMDIIDLQHLEIPKEVISMVSPSVAQVYRIVPVSFENGMLTVAMADPLNVNAIDDLRFMLNCEVNGAVANEQAVQEAVEKYYGGQTETIADLVKDIDSDEIMEVRESEAMQDISKLEEMASSAPVVKLVNLVLFTAIRDQASDVHFEPFEDEFKIRYRIDGSLLEMQPPPRQLALAIISRIKVMSNLDIAERRVPQDGRIPLNIGGNTVELRVSTLPTMFGESVVMRVLDRTVMGHDLNRLGLRDDEISVIQELMHKPNGIILVTGPTGSGKTTTLYSALNYINEVGLKIITTEDPVEYDLEGIIQVPIKEDIGVTYAACLRSILRQDPDKILVGEIRDLETAQIAIESSLTGHLVLSTLHTNDAPGTVTRLIEIGVEPFLLSATLEAVVAQRLIRVICTKCKDVYKPSEESIMELGLSLQEVAGKSFYYGKGCEHCNKTGYRGRSAIYEMMRITARLRQSIIERKSTDVLRADAQAGGMRTLRDSGLLKIFDGLSTIEEVIKQTLTFE
jgi:type IV pilus assembly protein PilB